MIRPVLAADEQAMLDFSRRLSRRTLAQRLLGPVPRFRRELLRQFVDVDYADHFALVAFLDDGRIEMDTNVVERAIRPHTLTRKNALFAGSDGGARHWAIAMTLIQTAKLNGVEPMAWLTDVLERIVSGRTKIHELHTLLPWTWQASAARSSAAPNFAVAA